MATNKQEDATTEASDVDEQTDPAKENAAESESEDRPVSAHEEGTVVEADGHRAAGSGEDPAGPEEVPVSPPAMSAPHMMPPSSDGEDPQTAEGRRAHLTLSRIEPWSVMKFSFVISVVCFVVLFVAVAVVYAILSSLGVFDAITDLITSLTDNEEGEDDLGLQPANWFSASHVLGYTALIGALNIILITALSTVGAMLYNLATDLVGGLDITLSESA